MTATPPVTITRVAKDGAQAGAKAPAPRLMVATPLYGGAEADYLRSVVGLTGVAERRGVACAFAWLSNNAVIDRARNVLAAAFLHMSRNVISSTCTQYREA